MFTFLLIKFNVRKSLCCGLRRVEDQSVPLALDVVVLRLLGDVETIKLQLPRKFFLPFEDHQWDLHKKDKRTSLRSDLLLGTDLVLWCSGAKAKSMALSNHMTFARA